MLFVAGKNGCCSKLVVVGAGGISGPPPIHSTKKGDFLFHIPEQSHSTEEEPLHFSRRRRRRKQVRRLSFGGGGGGGNLSPRIISPRPPSPLPLSLRPDLLLPFFGKSASWSGRAKRVAAEVCRRWWYGVNNICPGVNTTGTEGYTRSEIRPWRSSPKENSSRLPLPG